MTPVQICDAEQGVHCRVIKLAGKDHLLEVCSPASHLCLMTVKERQQVVRY